MTYVNCDQLLKRGWRLEWNEAHRILNLRFSVPRLMVPKPVANYPLREARLSSIGRQAFEMALQLGLHGGDAKTLFDFDDGWGVKQVDCTADLSVASPIAAASLIAGMKHPGKMHAFDTGVLWSAKEGGGRTDRYYAKGAELKKKLSKAAYAEVEQRHGSLDSTLRMEVSLMATDLKSVLGLSGSGWLPKPRVVTQPNFIRYVLYNELYSRLKLRNVMRRNAKLADTASGLGHDIARFAKSRWGEILRFDEVARLVYGYFLFKEHGGDANAISKEYGYPIGTVRKMGRRITEFGLTPTTAAIPRSDRLLGSFMQAFGSVCPTRPKKPTIPAHKREEWTVDAPWLLVPDTSRSVEGFEVVDADELEFLATDPELATAYGLAAS